MDRVIITGSRTYKDHQWVWQVLDELIDKENDIVVHGDCPTGADHYAANWCTENGVQQERNPARWNIHGSKAGPIRNQYMVGQGARLCIAFPILGAKGTWDCMNRAKKAGIMTLNMGDRYGK